MTAWADGEGPRASGQNFPRVHANAMAGHGGPYDLTLDFGYRPTPSDEPDTQVRVTTSWEHAAAMAKALQRLVDNYQQQVGQLPDLERVTVKEGEDDEND